MRKFKKPPIRFVLNPTYWPIWALMGFLQVVVRLPHSWRLAIGRMLGRATYHLIPSMRRITTINIGLCFPKLSKEEQLKLVKKSYLSTGMGIIETGMAWYLPKRRLQKLATFKGLENLNEAKRRGKGIIQVGLHLTTAELAGRMGTFYHTFSAVYQPTKNPLLDFILGYNRQKYYKDILSTLKTRNILQALDEGDIIWYAPDQSPSYKRCVFAPFFGVDTATCTSTARLARASGATIIPISHYRDDKTGKYTLYYHPPLDNFPVEDDIENATTINQLLESIIEKHPEQYLWQYKRFKVHKKGQPDVYKAIG